MKVLVVDDNAINRMVARRFLELLKCEVDDAASGKEAVAARFSNQYDLILMDCHMPDMNGLTATELIRERETATNAPRAPIVALTANAAPGSREECINAGMDDYHTKPVTRETLAQILARWATR